MSSAMANHDIALAQQCMQKAAELDAQVKSLQRELDGLTDGPATATSAHAPSPAPAPAPSRAPAPAPAPVSAKEQQDKVITQALLSTATKHQQDAQAAASSGDLLAQLFSHREASTLISIVETIKAGTLGAADALTVAEQLKERDVAWKE